LIFFVGRKTLKICFQALLDSVRLSICLGIISYVDMKLGTLELEQILPKIVSESWITVGDNRVKHAMEFENIIY